MHTLVIPLLLLYCLLQSSSCQAIGKSVYFQSATKRSDCECKVIAYVYIALENFNSLTSKIAY